MIENSPFLDTSLTYSSVEYSSSEDENHLKYQAQP